MGGFIYISLRPLVLVSVLFQRSAPCGRLHLSLVLVSVFVSHLISLYVNGCCCHHGCGSSVITAVGGNFRPGRVLPRPSCHENAVNRTKAAGDRTLVSMLQIQHSYCRRTHTHTHLFSFARSYWNAPVLLTEQPENRPFK